ncbi:MAG: hypothetical protein GY913_24080 [Proteobacteria bacterium]|nr:hypothetical protein [Pseudomonadota bacterium]MCP4919993.1 hypothetical protein [Pseudomonadota bacterium]
MAWVFVDQPVERSDEASGDVTCTWTGTMETSDLICPDWRIRTTGWGESASIEMVDGTLYVARFHPIASGARVHAYDAASGREIWRSNLWGCGPVSHSKYRNEVHLVVLDEGITAFGRESQCRYVEVLDPRTGAPLGHRQAAD